MPGEPVLVGPFTGGLNNFSDPTAVLDNELVVCDNFELDLDGSLKSRPPFTDTGTGITTGNLQILGWYEDATSGAYLLASDGVTSTYQYHNGAWTLITNTVSGASMAQFNGFAYVTAPATSSQVGGHWSPSGGWVADANMPKGDSIISNKFRLWIAAGKSAVSNPTRMYYSNVLGASTFWPASPNFIDIGAGDGQAIVALQPYYGVILIFRTESVYSYSFGSDPAAGNVLPVLPTIGLEDKYCLAASEAYLYFMYRGRLYEFVNNRANQINPKTVFKANSQAGIGQAYAVSVFNKRIVVSFYDTMYVFNLVTRTWTSWTTSAFGAVGTIIMEPGDPATAVTALCSSSKTVAVGTRSPLLQIVDEFDAVNAESMVSRLVTKNYNYNSSAQFKRLFWWGIDATFRGVVHTTVSPIVGHFRVTYSQLRAYTYSQLRAYTYGQMLSTAPSSDDIVDTSGASALRRFVKLLKSLRFRQVNYAVSFEHDGSTATAPVRVFSLTTYVLVKEHVTAKVS